MPRSNSLIACVEPDVWAAYEDKFAALELDRGATLHQPGQQVEHVHFPATAVIVLGVETLGGESVNVSLLGREGALGVFEACGSRQIYSRATVQFRGILWQTAAATYRSLYDSSMTLRTAIHKYVETLMVEARQNVACNALHSVENRLARTLLDAADKFGSSKLPITQVALAQLLGVQRTTIAAAISELQRNGHVRSDRSGGLEILRPQGLEAAACSCRDSLAFSRHDIHSQSVRSCDA